MSLVLGMAASLSAQGITDYMNFESPQVKPITTVTINDRRYLLACNTPDNSVEVYAIDRLELSAEDPGDGSPGADPDFGFCARIPVGLEPVSVTTHSFTESEVEVARMYTANWLGDSVTYVKLQASTNSGLNDEEAFSFTVERTVWGGDEPMCVAVMDTEEVQALFVTKRSNSSYSQMDLDDGDFQHAYEHIPGSGPTLRVQGGKDVIMASTGVIPNPNGMFTHPITSDSVLDDQPMAMKEPHTVVIQGDVAWMLGHQGGGSKLDHELVGEPFPVDEYNFDLWAIDLQDKTVPVGTFHGFEETIGEAVRNIGTTNFNMALSGNGTTLYVVGTDALNDEVGNPDLLALPTGFVRTLLYKVSISIGTSPPSVAVSSVDFLDLNDGATASTSLAHATDVAIYRESIVCVVAFNSDRFGVVDTSGASTSWDVATTNMPANAGPRALTIALDPDPEAEEPVDRAYVLNRLENSISILGLDGASAATLLLTVDLQVDPVPAYIREGQKYLYSTDFSGSGFVACASCHIDGRSDQQQWRLGSEDLDLLDTIQPPLDLPVAKHEIASDEECILADLEQPFASGDGFPSRLADDNLAPLDISVSIAVGEEETCRTSQTASENSKGPMITQSLQGLLNFEVGGDLFALVSNAPYHWRGDKESFLDFNEAFVNLQGEAEELDEEDMLEFEAFVNSINYPPNPIQPMTRVYSGSFGSGVLSATGAQKGLRAFHVLPQTLIPGDRTRSCVQCHTLPDGSNNRLTFIESPRDVNNDPENELYPAELKHQPTETAALRNLGPKEGRLEFDSFVPLLSAGARTYLRTGDLGTGHEGLNGFSRNAFVQPLATDSTRQTFQSAIVQYMREFDHGVAPIIGQVVTVFPTDIAQVSGVWTITTTAKANLVSEMEHQVGGTSGTGFANAGLVGYVRTQAAGDKGYWYRVDTSGSNYIEEPGASTALTLAEILEDIDANAANVGIFTSVPLGSERRIALLDDSDGVSDFDAASTSAPTDITFVDSAPNTANVNIPLLGDKNFPGTSVTVPISPAVGDFVSLDAFDLLQASLGIGPGHDAPRRIRLKGTDLRPGAQVALIVETTGSVNKRIELPIYPTKEFDGSGENNRIWETAVELDPMNLYILLLGGPADEDVIDILADPGSASTASPAPNYSVEVRNALSSWSALSGTRTLLY